jgi:surfactin synthase thioesterase subunit
MSGWGGGLAADRAAGTKWFIRKHPGPAATAILFCFPFAGGGAGAYRRWVDSDWAGIDVQPVQLPGRENRMGELPGFTVAEVTAALLPRLDRPFALYGHSMGGRLAFEVVRELRRRGAPAPVRLYLGATRPPDAPPDPGDRPGGDVMARLASLGGPDDGALANPELRELLLPVLRSDFAWIDAYRHSPEPPLDVPLVVVAGRDDPAVPPTVTAGWQRHTVAGCRLLTLPGGHLFLRTRPDELAELIRADLRRVTETAHR